MVRAHPGVETCTGGNQRWMKIARWKLCQPTSRRGAPPKRLRPRPASFSRQRCARRSRSMPFRRANPGGAPATAAVSRCGTPGSRGRSLRRLGARRAAVGSVRPAHPGRAGHGEGRGVECGWAADQRGHGQTDAVALSRAGLVGSVDHRGTRAASPYGRVDDRVVAAVAAVMDAETGESTGTRSRLRRRVEQLLAEQHGVRVVPTVVLDVATRSICAAVLRPQGTKAVDARQHRRPDADGVSSSTPPATSTTPNLGSSCAGTTRSSDGPEQTTCPAGAGKTAASPTGGHPHGPVWSRDHVAGKGLDGMMLGLVACS
jgi:hypothetical protein